jgi:hypothetical protein
MLDAEDPTERRLQPSFRQSGRVTARIRRISECDVVMERGQSFGERECRLSMDADEGCCVENLNVLLQRADALRILLHEIGADCPPGQCFESERTRAGIEIEHAGTGKIQLKDAHPGFANPVKSWPNV